MSDYPAQSPQRYLGRREAAQLPDVLERVLDKGIVIAGDIQVSLLDIELLTIKLRLLVAIHKFARRMLAGKPLPFFGDGSTRRDYTYVDDILAGVLAALERPIAFDIVNLGGAHTTSLRELI